MADAIGEIEWSDQLESYLSRAAEQAQCLSVLHKRSEAYYAWLRNYTDLPVIILGVLNGSVSIGSNSLFDDAKMASVGVGCMALLTAVLSTVSSYFGWAKRAEAHRIASLSYVRFYRSICIQLSLPRSERTSLSELVKYVKNETDRLQEISPLVPERLIDQFKKGLGQKYPEIAKPPEANGLEKVVIYTPTENLQ